MKSKKQYKSKDKASKIQDVRPSQQRGQGAVQASVQTQPEANVKEVNTPLKEASKVATQMPSQVTASDSKESSTMTATTANMAAPPQRPQDFVEAAKPATKPKLEVLICTRSNTRLNHIRELPKIKGVAYLISCQVGPQQMPVLPEHLRRDDIRLSVINSMGLSLNRNNAFENAVGEICLIGDDDLEYDPEGLKKVIESFEKHPEIDFALFRHKGYARSGPDREYNCSRRFKRNHHAVSFDIAVRKSTIIDKHKMRFNPNFGVGLYDFTAGEENLFCLDMQRKWKVKGRYFPIDICTHAEMTTSEKAGTDPKVLHAEGAIIARRWPITGLLRIFRKAYRLNKVNPFSLARHMFYGWRKAVFKPSSLGF